MSGKKERKIMLKESHRMQEKTTIVSLAKFIGANDVKSSPKQKKPSIVKPLVKITKSIQQKLTSFVVKSKPKSPSKLKIQKRL